MKHLTDEQLSARLDGALPEPELAACDEHLAGCDACRARLADYSEMDASLGRALTHDPGDAYFADFAERVSARIAAASGAGVAAAAAAAPARPAAGRSPWGWLLSPRGLTLAGSTAALVLVAGVAWVRFRSHDDVASALREAERPAPSSTLSDQATPPPSVTPAPEEGRLEQRAPSPAAESPPGGAARAREAKLEANLKEQSASDTRLQQREKQEPAKSLAAEMKRRSLQPAQEKAVARDELGKTDAAAPAPAASTFGAPAPSAPRFQANEEQRSLALTNELDPPCGTVHDTRGRPLAGAQIVAMGADARSAKSGADGSFCLPSLRAGDTLSVLRVGYEPLRVVVRPATSLALQLEPVGTLGPQSGGLAAAPQGLTEGEDASKFSFARRPAIGHVVAPAADIYAGQPAAIRLAVADARRLTAQARRDRTAASFEKAADRWERIGTLTSGKAGLDARFQGLGALREAYRLAPIPARATRLRARLISFIEAAPDTLPERTTAVRWQSELGEQ